MTDMLLLILVGVEVLQITALLWRTRRAVTETALAVVGNHLQEEKAQKVLLATNVQSLEGRLRTFITQSNNAQQQGLTIIDGEVQEIIRLVTDLNERIGGYLLRLHVVETRVFGIPQRNEEKGQ